MPVQFHTAKLCQGFLVFFFSGGLMQIMYHVFILVNCQQGCEAKSIYSKMSVRVDAESRKHFPI